MGIFVLVGCWFEEVGDNGGGFVLVGGWERDRGGVEGKVEVRKEVGGGS